MDSPPVPALEQVLVARDRHVATVTLNQPEHRNPLSAAMLRDLIAAFRWCQGEPVVRVVVLTGAGDRAFCAGADLASFESDVPELERHHGRHAFVELFALMASLGKPIVGRINGTALAGGLGLATSCDLLIAVDTATFATPEVNVGIWPMMIQAVLMRNLPRKVLLEMIMLGDRWTATQMQSAGVVNRVVERHLLDSTVAEITDKLAKKSPAVMRLGRDSFYLQQDMEFHAALDYLQSQLTLVTLTEDAKEGVAAFFQKREPEFKGR
jgi:enoyl-CoA hydratase